MAYLIRSQDSLLLFSKPQKAFQDAQLSFGGQNGAGSHEFSDDQVADVECWNNWPHSKLGANGAIARQRDDLWSNCRKSAPGRQPLGKSF